MKRLQNIKKTKFSIFNIDQGRIKIKKTIFLFVFIHLLFPTSLFPKANKVIVTAENANIYSKPNIKSYLIETVEKETILSLFQTQKLSKVWYYISFYSEKRKAYISGFVKVTAVEIIDHTQKKLKNEQTELKKEKLINTASPTMEAIAFQKIIEPPVEIKTEEMPLINPSPTMEAIAFQKIIETLEETKVEKKPLFIPLPKKETLSSQKLKETQEELKEEKKLLKIASPTKEVITSQNIKEEKTLIKKSLKEIEMSPMPVKTISPMGKFRLITFGIGYGQSHGGAGGFIQFNTKAGLSFHGGIGYFPAYLIYSGSDWVRSTMLFSGGLKYYLPLRVNPLSLYLDLQFCGIGVEAAHIFSGVFYNGPLFDNVQKTLWGPSLLGGVEVKMGMIGLNGALGFSYNITEAEWLDQNIFLTFDFGLLVYF